MDLCVLYTQLWKFFVDLSDLRVRFTVYFAMRMFYLNVNINNNNTTRCDMHVN